MLSMLSVPVLFTEVDAVTGEAAAMPVGAASTVRMLTAAALTGSIW